jgi:hypothetical protein
MSIRDGLKALLLGVIGIAAAAAIAVAANRITGEEVGLSSEPVSVIPANASSPPKPAPGFDRELEERDAHEDGEDDNSGPGSGDNSDDGDDSGSGNRGPGSGPDDSGGGDSGEDSSGSGSSGSGSSGSG